MTTMRPPRGPWRARAACTVAISLIAATAATGSGVARPETRGGTPSAAAPHIAESFGRLPISFEPNIGQAPAGVRYVARDTAAFVTPSSVVLAGGPKPVTLAFVGASPSARVVAADELPGKTNYLQGDDPERWKTNVPTYATVRCEQVYRGIDVVYYGKGQNLEYDVVVAPGCDVGAVSFELEGAPAPEIDAGGALVAGGIRLEPPFAYQTIDGARCAVESRYVLHSGRVGFEVGSYDTTLPLVVDPEIGYSYGFAEAGKDIQVNGIAVDSSGAAYVAGRFKSAGAGGVLTIEAYVAKLNPEGTALVYSTILGGADLDTARAIAVDSEGNAFITGQTYSGNYPTTPGAFQTTNPQPTRIDAFVTKIGPNGSTLIYSSYLGGGDFELGEDIKIDASGNAYVVGTTSSTNFPTTTPAQPGRGGATDAFVTKVNVTGSAKVYSTYLGGSESENGLGIAVDTAGNAYAVGSTFSTNFPTTAGVLQTSTGGGLIDAFWAKYDAAGQRIAATYLGGSGNDLARAVAVDDAGNTYLTGEAASADFPLLNPVQSTLNGAQDAFVSILNPGGTALVFSTFYGGSNYETGNAIIVHSGLVYVIGDTYSSDFPTVDPLQPAYGGGISDAFVLQLDPSAGGGGGARGAGAILFASNLGGTRTDFGVDGALSQSGSLFVGSFLPNLSSGSENEQGQIVEISLEPPPPQPDLEVRAVGSVIRRRGEEELIIAVKVTNLDTCGGGRAQDITLQVEIPDGAGVGYDGVSTRDYDVNHEPEIGQAGTVDFYSRLGASVGQSAFCTVSLKFPNGVPNAIIRFRVTAETAGDCVLSNNEAVVEINPSDPPSYEAGQAILFAPAKQPLGAPKAQLVANAGSGQPRSGAAEKTSTILGFNVYASSQPGVLPVPGNLFTTVDPSHRIADVSGAPAGAFFVVTTVTDSGESAPSNEVGGVLPTVTKLKVSGSKVVAQGTGFTNDVEVFFGGIPFTTAPKLKKANTKVVQKGLLGTGETLGEFINRFVGADSKVQILFLNGNGNGVAVEYSP